MTVKSFYYRGVAAIMICFGAQLAHANSVPENPPVAKDAYAIPLKAIPIPLNHKDHNITRVGKLRYMGGLKLTSSKHSFGGISSLVISPDGSQILGISDHSYWLIADMVYDQQGRLINITHARMAPLKEIPGQKKYAVRDAEALTAVDGAGFVVSFESPHTLRYYQASHPYDYGSLFNAKAQKISFAPDLPKTISALPDNLGIEALTTMPDGRMLALSENTRQKDGKFLAEGWLIGHGKIEDLDYQISPSYKPTDMTTLPNGDILVLERHFSLARGMASRLTRISVREITPGKIITGEVVADLAYPFNLDNMEALTMRKNDKGETLIYIMSDNNYNKLQRTLLMMFKLEK